MEEMKRNGTRRVYPLIGVLGITVLVLLILSLFTASAATVSSVSNQLTMTETQVTTSGACQGTFAIYGDTVVWTDYRSAYPGDIYACDVSNFQEIRFTTTGTAYDPDIYGSKIVWVDIINHNIYMYDISTAKKIQITTSGTASPPVIYGDRIVWMDGRNGLTKTDVYMYNISTSTETRLTTSGSSKVDPDMFGDKIVWVDGRNGNSDIYMFDLSTYKEMRITSNEARQSLPAIYDNKIIWQDFRDGINHIYMYDLSTSIETQITNESGQGWPDIYGDKIVYRDGRNGNLDIYMYDLSTFTETQITTNISNQDYPKIYGDRIVWDDSRDRSSNLYMCTLLENEPEPIFPIANFSTNVTSGYAPLSVQFTDLSPNATGWNWNFGDEVTSTEQNPTHTYSKAGTYTVNLTASNSNGTDSRTATINVLKTTPTITWSNPADIIQGTALSSTQLNAVASVPGTFVYTPAEGTVLSAGTQTLHVDFTPTDIANYNTTSKDVTINVLTPVQKIEQIISMVQNLNLNSGQSNNLIVKLNEAVKSLNLGKTNESINKLNSFVNEVKGYINSGVLSQAEGQALIDEANSVINALSPK